MDNTTNWKSKMYSKWLENINKNKGLDKFVPTEGTRICSEHFSPDMKEEGGSKVILKPYAFPTIFPTLQVCAFVYFSFYFCFFVDLLYIP